MAKILFLTFILFQSSNIYVKSENKFLSLFVENIMVCITQAPDNFTMDTCNEMIREGNDNSQPQYKNCKCLAACTGKRLGLITDKGEGNMEKLKYYISIIDHDDWSKEAKVIAEKCSHIKNDDACSFAYEWLSCGLNNSKMAFDLLKTFINENKKSESA